jgi:hypothetical protein
VAANGLYPGPHSGGDVFDQDGNPIGGMMLWITNGRLSALEYWWVTDEPPSELPKLHQIQPLGLGR